MDDAAFRTELLKRADSLLEIQREHEQRPLLERIARSAISVVTLIAIGFGGYEGYLAWERRSYADKYKSLGIEYLINGKYERATATLRVAEKLRPEDPEI